MRKVARIGLFVPVFYVGLPELSVMLVNRLGPRLALALVAWCASGIFSLALIIIGGIVCLLVKRLSYWPRCWPERA